MTDNNKPEWFEIAEGDGPTQPAKVRRSLPIAAVMATALVLGVGAVIAQTQESTPASATTSEAMTASSDAQPSVNQVSSNNLEAATPSNPSATSSSTGLANPSIAKLPSGGEREEGEHGDRPRGPRPPHQEHDEDDEDEDEEDDDEDDDEMKAPVIPQG